MADIAFPGLGIKEFALDRTAFSIGNVTVYWYGIIVCLAMVCGFAFAYMRMKKEGMTGDDLADLILFCVPVGIVGARLYYVLTSLDSYKSFWDVIAVWNGGLAIYGGIIAGVATFTLVCRHKKMPVLQMYDCAAPGLVLGQIIGRWGNFFNAEAYGIADKYEILGKSFDISGTIDKNPLRMMINGETVHPTFLYESLWNLLGFALMNLLFKKKAFDGEVLLWYIGWYGLGRFFIEGLRGDSLYVGNIRISQLLALLCFVFALCAVAALRIRKYLNERKTENGNNN